nr:DnaA/Hda family protein [Burkholderiaceae bacterium]
MNDLWQACASHLESELPAQLYRTWIKPLVFLGYDEDAQTLKLGAPNRVKLDWVRAQYGERIAALAAQLISPDTRVSFEISAGADPEPQAATNGHPGHEHPAAPTAAHATLDLSGAAALPGFAAQTAGPGERVAHAAAPDERGPRPGFSALQPSVSPAAERSRLNPDLTFETFVTGKANDLARAAALQVAERPGGAYNPLFLYGGVGLGKTHLIHAVGNAILQRAPGANIRYITANQFFQDMVASIRRQSVDEFKRYYQSLDLLLIDDIQFFAGKERSQEEFFYAFENLIAERKQIIITSDTY